MTDPKQVSDIECSICGKDGGPTNDCEMCHGNQRFIAQRSFTLTEERKGLNPDRDKRRYGPQGDVNPRIVVLPGGFDPSQGRQD